MRFVLQIYYITKLLKNQYLKSIFNHGIPPKNAAASKRTQFSSFQKGACLFYEASIKDSALAERVELMYNKKFFASEKIH